MEMIHNTNQQMSGIRKMLFQNKISSSYSNQWEVIKTFFVSHNIPYSTRSLTNKQKIIDNLHLLQNFWGMFQLYVKTIPPVINQDDIETFVNCSMNEKQNPISFPIGIRKVFNQFPGVDDMYIDLRYPNSNTFINAAHYISMKRNNDSFCYFRLIKLITSS
jgi:hypothetical protein